MSQGQSTIPERIERKISLALAISLMDSHISLLIVAYILNDIATRGLIQWHRRHVACSTKPHVHAEAYVCMDITKPCAWHLAIWVYLARSANLEPEAFSRTRHVLKTAVSMKHQFLEHAVF